MIRIYEHVGGIPLALTLIAKLLGAMSIYRCLEGLHRGKNRKVEENYANIYKRVISLIDETSFQLLLDMLSVSVNGVDLEGLKERISTVSELAFDNALMQLI